MCSFSEFNFIFSPSKQTSHFFHLLMHHNGDLMFHSYCFGNLCQQHCMWLVVLCVSNDINMFHAGFIIDGKSFECLYTRTISQWVRRCFDWRTTCQTAMYSWDHRDDSCQLFFFQMLLCNIYADPDTSLDHQFLNEDCKKWEFQSTDHF